MSLQPLKPSLFTLLNPGKRLPFVLGGISLAILLWAFLLGFNRLSLSSASLLGFGLVIVSVSPKWLDDVKRWGLSIGLLGVVITLQSLHMLEHAVQVFQYYWLGWTANKSLGLISAFNVEWVHFSWNWLVWLLMVFLVMRGLRNGWAYALLLWATLHSLEHTYLMFRYWDILKELGLLNLSSSSVTQALPGVLGRDGLLALSSWCARIPGLSTAPRSVIHFWWNFGELSLLLLAAYKGTSQLSFSHSFSKKETL